MDPAREQTKEEEVTIRGQRRLIAESGQTESSGGRLQGDPRLSRLLQTAQSELEQRNPGDRLEDGYIWICLPWLLAFCLRTEYPSEPAFLFNRSVISNSL